MLARRTTLQESVGGQLELGIAKKARLEKNLAQLPNWRWNQPMGDLKQAIKKRRGLINVCSKTCRSDVGSFVAFSRTETLNESLKYDGML